MKHENKVKPLLLLSGIAVGAFVFANIEFSFPGPGGSGFGVHSRPNYATAKNNFENYPIASLKNFNEAFVQIAESATPSVVTIFTEHARSEERR